MINPLLVVADVLEKVAAVFEEEEKLQQEKTAQELNSNFIEPIRSAFPNISNNVREKLAGLDPEVLSFLKNAAVKSQDADYGFGHSIEKVASQQDGDALLAFMMSED